MGGGQYGGYMSPCRYTATASFHMEMGAKTMRSPPALPILKEDAVESWNFGAASTFLDSRPPQRRATKRR